MQPPKVTPPAFDYVDLKALAEQDKSQRDTYPIKVRKTNWALIVIALLVLVGGAAGAILYFGKKGSQPAANAPAKTAEAPVAKPPVVESVDAAVVAEVSIDAAPEPTPEPKKTEPTKVETPKVETPKVETPKMTPTPTPATTTPKSTPGATPTPGKIIGKTKPEPTGSGDSGDPKASNPTGDPECDEVQCVMSKYDRPCCERYRPREPNAKPGIPEDLDKAMIRAGVETVKPRIIACGEQISVKGTVKVSVKVSDAGVVKEATVTDSPSPELGECVADALRKAKFAKSMNGAAFVYPFVF